MIGTWACKMHHCGFGISEKEKSRMKKEYDVDNSRRKSHTKKFQRKNGFQLN